MFCQALGKELELDPGRKWGENKQHEDEWTIQALVEQFVYHGNMTLNVIWGPEDTAILHEGHWVLENGHSEQPN